MKNMVLNCAQNLTFSLVQLYHPLSQVRHIIKTVMEVRGVLDYTMFITKFKKKKYCNCMVCIIWQMYFTVVLYLREPRQKKFIKICSKCKYQSYWLPEFAPVTMIVFPSRFFLLWHFPLWSLTYKYIQAYSPRPTHSAVVSVVLERTSPISA